MTSTLHPGWQRLAKYPKHAALCPRCSSPQPVRAQNWRWDEGTEQWLCRRPSCMERPAPITVTISQRIYAPVPH